MSNGRFYSAFVVLIMIFAAAVYVTRAEVPLGPSTFTPGVSSRQNESAYPAGIHNAYAGNITQLTIAATGQTKHWQGYYGEVSGTIVLDDADNWTLYDWPQPEPKGEIYATVNQTTPDWASVACFDYTASGGAILSGWETYYNMTWNDVDGINETFNSTTHKTFDVGQYTITADTCPSTWTFVNDLRQSDKFSEVLLTDSNNYLIFTTIIENDDGANNTDPIGYNGQTHDFQMLVAEDGTSQVGGIRNTATTPYYFYVDIQ